MQKLEYNRVKKSLGNFKSDLFEYVPAMISHLGQDVKVKIRLKGDRKIHYESLETASFRIKIKGNNTLFSMKIFSCTLMILIYVKELRIQEKKFMFLKKLKLGILVQKQLMMNFLMKWNFREIGT